MKHALVNKDNVVVNIILWDGAEWKPPVDHYVIQSDEAQINDIYDPQNNVFIKPKKDK